MTVRRICYALAGGFTLVELLVVISIAAILAAIAVPSLQNTMLMNRADTASNQFAAVLSMARSEAVKQGITVSVCLSGSGVPPCPTTSGDLSNWSPGWVVCCAPGTAVPVQAGGALSGKMTSFGSTELITFEPTGRLPVGFQAQIFIFCPDGADATKAYLVTVQTTGRVRVVTPVNGQVPMNDNNHPMNSCTQPTAL